ncbi:palmitoyltransferase swf1 [Gnomoniopsis sp. IMI 355080]|nr:palmitoyltransferase swf1 [Gnomoniopsis sp. IMI 355080]
MVSFTTIALIVLFISFMTFVAFFGRIPVFRNTPVAWLHNFIWNTIPASLLALDRTITGGRLSSNLQRFGNYMLYDRHPTVVIFFLILLAGGEYMFLPGAWPLLSPLYRTLTIIAVICPYVFLYLSCSVDPGYITRENHAFQMAQYPFDFAMFHPGAHCRTCQLLKPARSKHCSVCKHCVAKADHHCIFINSCVGAGNLHWFILLLFSTALLTGYGSWMGLSLMGDVIRARWADFSLWPPAAKGYNWSQYLLMWSYGLQADVGVGAVSLLMLLTTPLIWGLWAYNMYMIWAGTTTNESLKWSDWREDIADGLAYRRRMSPSRQKDLRFEPAWTKWPIEAETIMIHYENGPPPAESSNFPGIGEWTQVQRLREVDNLYDLGFWDNLRDVFWPQYRFAKGSAAVPVAERGRRRQGRDSGRED